MSLRGKTTIQRNSCCQRCTCVRLQSTEESIRGHHNVRKRRISPLVRAKTDSVKVVRRLLLPPASRGTAPRRLVRTNHDSVVAASSLWPLWR